MRRGVAALGLCVLGVALSACGTRTVTKTTTVVRTTTGSSQSVKSEPRVTYAPPQLRGLAPLTNFVPAGVQPGGGIVLKGQPKRLVVYWTRSHRDIGGASQSTKPWIVSVWELRGDRLNTQWNRILRLDTVPGLSVPTATRGDLTHDGNDDVLLAQDDGGSGGCGPRRVLASVGSHMRQIFLRSDCDFAVQILGGNLVINTSQYSVRDSHCCPIFTHRTVLQWSGGELTPIDSAVLWNGDYQIRHRRMPLKFVPIETAYWDKQRGLAVGNGSPWLLGRTRDGGASWQIVDASACPLAPPQLTGPARATVRFLRCGDAIQLRVATRNYGKSWTIPGA
jgi:hypothetical protein